MAANLLLLRALLVVVGDPWSTLNGPATAQTARPRPKTTGTMLAIVPHMFVEVIGDQPFPDAVDRDDVEDLLEQTLGGEGSVTGAGTGDGRWHLDVELDTDGRPPQLLVRRLAQALVHAGLGWVRIRPEAEETGLPASALV
jgi:hypothetical protein